MVGSFSSDLTEQPLGELIAAAQNDPRNDALAMCEIVQRFRGLAFRLANSRTACEAMRQDLEQVQLMAVVTAVRRHDGRPGFASYCRRYMKGAVSRELARDRIATISLDDEANPDTIDLAASSMETGAQAWGLGRVGHAVSALPARQQEILRQRYIDDQPLKVIAAASGTSVPAVSQRLATAHRAVTALLAA